MISLNKICTCGRAWLHCTSCGSGSLYCLHDASVHASQKHTGKPVDDTGLVIKIYRCKACGESFQETDTCSAPSEHQKKQLRSTLRNIEAQIINESVQSTTSTFVPSVTQPTIDPLKNEDLPEGWGRNAEGKIEAPISLSDIIKKGVSKE